MCRQDHTPATRDNLRFARWIRSKKLRARKRERGISAEKSALASGRQIAARLHVNESPSCFVYVLRSINYRGRFYVGLSADVRSRLVAHNEGRSPHTAAHRPWELVVCLAFTDEGTAARFAKYLKSGAGRAFAERHFT